MDQDPKEWAPHGDGDPRDQYPQAWVPRGMGTPMDEHPHGMEIP